MALGEYKSNNQNKIILLFLLKCKKESINFSMYSSLILFNIFEKTGKMWFKKGIFKDTSVNIILEAFVWFCLYSFAYYGLLFA